MPEASVTPLPFARRTHLDGTPCLEGTRRVPAGFTPCCETFAAHTATCEHDLRYEWWANASEWVIRLPTPGGGGGVSISHCPHCGAALSSAHP